MKRDKIIVLCVDRDNDLGEKTGIEGPVIGRDENLKAAYELAIADPEEADANAIFGAIREYDRLKRENPDKEIEIVTITGDSKSNYRADQKIRAQIESVLERFKTNYAILVSDGVDDEIVIPLLHEYFPSISPRRIIVQQSKDLEETYFLMKRYLKKLYSDPTLRTITIGLPGLIMFSAALLAIWGYQGYIWKSVAGVLGAFMMIKGFGVTPTVNELKGWIGGKLGMFTFTVGAILIVIAAVYVYFRAIELAVRYPSIIALTKTLQEGLILAVLGIVISVTGGVLEKYASKDAGFIDRIFMISLTIILYFIVYQLLRFLQGEISIIYLSSLVVLGVMIAAGSFAAAMTGKKRMLEEMRKKVESKQ